MAEHSRSNRTIWSHAREQIVIDAMTKSENEKCTKQVLYYKKQNEIVKIGPDMRVIVKGKDTSEPLIFRVPFEDLYEKLLEAHIQTSHGGRVKMLYYCKNQWRIGKQACSIFVSVCLTCNKKQVAPKKEIVAIISDGFNMRGQVDSIDFQSCKDGEFKWLMNYQDHETNFSHLRPLKSKQVANVAEELSKIFFTFGAPRIL